MLSLKEGIEQLSNLLKQDKLIIFAGSGMSVPSGLPAWEGFLEQFVLFCESIVVTYEKHDIAHFCSHKIISHILSIR